jgi:hypothetical membrane protein
VVARQWPTRFSLAEDMISALGNTSPCVGQGRESPAPCSPWHTLMNTSFITIGVTMSLGAVLTRRAFAPGWRRRSAVALFLLGGIGVVLVGLYPENESELLHATGAAANLFGANVALVLYGLTVSRAAGRTVVRVLGVASGVTGLVAAFLFVQGTNLGIGAGGMERVAIYPITIFQIVAGFSLWIGRPEAASSGGLRRR